jgi:hypothetical protein
MSEPLIQELKTHVDSAYRNAGLPSGGEYLRLFHNKADALATAIASLREEREREWCLTCGTVTRDKQCHCTEPHGCGFKQELVNYGDEQNKLLLEQIAENTKLEADNTSLRERVRELEGALGPSVSILKDAMEACYFQGHVLHGRRMDTQMKQIAAILDEQESIMETKP